MGERADALEHHHARLARRSAALVQLCVAVAVVAVLALGGGGRPRPPPRAGHGGRAPAGRIGHLRDRADRADGGGPLARRCAPRPTGSLRSRTCRSPCVIPTSPRRWPTPFPRSCSRGRRCATRPGSRGRSTGSACACPPRAGWRSPGRAAPASRASSTRSCATGPSRRAACRSEASTSSGCHRPRPGPRAPWPTSGPRCSPAPCGPT